jgi:prophage maintenance system killer protein
MALYAITNGRPFWDCNKRTGWFVCYTIMSSVDYALRLSDGEVELLVLAVEDSRLDEGETIEAVRRAFSHHLASKRQSPGRS